MPVRKPKTEVLPPAKPMTAAFKTRVKGLTDDYRNMAASYAELAERMIHFAERFRSLWDQAHDLDGGDFGQHNEYIKAEMGEAVGTTNPSIWSRWVKIGSQAKALLPYKDALPPQRDALYEISKAIEERQPIKQWVKQGQLTNETPFREVVALRTPKRRKRKSRKKTYQVAVTLRFHKYEDAADALAGVIQSDLDFTVNADNTFQNALKSVLEPAAYETAQTRFA